MSQPVPNQQIEELSKKPEMLSEFEHKFIFENLERVKKYGDKTKFSQKQGDLLDRIYQQRIVKGEAPKKAEV